MVLYRDNLMNRYVDYDQMCEQLAWHVEAIISDGCMVDRVVYWKTNDRKWEALITYKRPEKLTQK